MPKPRSLSDLKEIGCKTVALRFFKSDRLLAPCGGCFVREEYLIPQT
jgi:hypothetical protein